MKLQGDVIGLDLGMSRTGVARINTIARIAEPLPVIHMKEGDIVEALVEIVRAHAASAVVVGLPRGLDGQTTTQTLWAQSILKELAEGLSVPVFSIDEAATTVQAEKIAGSNQAVDSVAAGIIAENFIDEVARGRIADVTLSA